MTHTSVRTKRPCEEKKDIKMKKVNKIIYMLTYIKMEIW